MKILVFSLFAMIISGCSAVTGPATIVFVEGEEHAVIRLKSNAKGYRAHETNIWGGWIDPEDYRKNILAIEMVTGCKVDRDTIVNSGLLTDALVVCDAEEQK